MHRKQVHDALRQPQKEHAIVERLRAVSALDIAAGVVQKHQIEVGTVAKLEAAELAVGNRRDADRPQALGSPALRSAMYSRQLLPGEPHRLLDDEFGDIGQAITHLHQRQATAQIGVRDAKDCRPLELPQRLDLALGIVVRHVLAADRQLGGELRGVSGCSSTRWSTSSSSSKGNAAI